MKDYEIRAITARARKTVLKRFGPATERLVRDHYYRRQPGTVNNDVLVNSLVVGDKAGFDLAVGEQNTSKSFKELRQEITNSRKKGRVGNTFGGILLGMHLIQAIVVVGFLLATAITLGSGAPYFGLHSNYKTSNVAGDALIDDTHDDGSINMQVFIYVIYSMVFALCIAVIVSVWRAKKVDEASRAILSKAKDFNDLFTTMWENHQNRKVKPDDKASEKAKKMLRNIINPTWKPKKRSKEAEYLNEEDTRKEYQDELLGLFTDAEYDDLTRFNFRRWLVFVTYMTCSFGVQTIANAVYQMDNLYMFINLHLITLLSIFILLFQRYIRSTVKTYLRKLTPLEHAIVVKVNDETVKEVEKAANNAAATDTANVNLRRRQTNSETPLSGVYTDEYQRFTDETLLNVYPTENSPVMADASPWQYAYADNPSVEKEEYEKNEMIANAVVSSRIRDKYVLTFLAILSVVMVAWVFFTMVVYLDKTQGAIANAASLVQTKTLPAITLVSWLVLHLGFHSAHWWLLYLWNNVADKIGFPLRKAGVDIFQMGLCITMWGVSSITYVAIHRQNDYPHYFN